MRDTQERILLERAMTLLNHAASFENELVVELYEKLKEDYSEMLNQEQAGIWH